MKFDQETIRQAVDVLKQSDTTMKRLIETVGPCSLDVDPSPFRMLIRAITGQQLSVAAAKTIWTRFLILNGTQRVSAVGLSRLTDAELRSVGISRNKIQSIRGIQRAFANRDISIRQLRGMSDDDVRTGLCELRGVGPWTADMFLMFGLGRLDVFPVGDLGLVNAIGEFYRHGERPNKVQMLEMGNRWAPYRTVATWYCWRGLDALRSGQLSTSYNMKTKPL